MGWGGEEQFCFNIPLNHSFQGGFPGCSVFAWCMAGGKRIVCPRVRHFPYHAYTQRRGESTANKKWCLHSEETKTTPGSNSDVAPGGLSPSSRIWGSL